MMLRYTLQAMIERQDGACCLYVCNIICHYYVTFIVDPAIQNLLFYHYTLLKMFVPYIVRERST